MIATFFGDVWSILKLCTGQLNDYFDCKREIRVLGSRQRSDLILWLEN